ncbi:nitroreductase [Polymorphobacter arshaanensis]|uniref:Nitroreductase n=1 Tax=Glacieibacterium arshaanense TaxID=2511025 RepID=A0A4Y9ES65_9SPHN|nr:nitroreductase [Polymorphobacter arshaanensis]TFU06477.1 nitroreductase [Polymorphobacter arshaanensis]
MKVSEALESRKSVRAFTDAPVDPAVIRRVLATASRAPSGGNVQPWHVDVVGGAELEALKAQVREAIAKGAQTPEYAIYPEGLGEPYKSRRFGIGEAMYAALGVPREDKAGRMKWFMRNFAFFDAPVALFTTVARTMGPPQWSDLGMFLQSVMLMLREEGLDSCAQECWAIYPETIRGFLGTPPERMLFCGMAIGHADTSAPVNTLHSARAPIEEFAHFRGI